MRFPKKFSIRAWVILFACLAIILFSSFRVFQNYELISYDLRFSLRPALKTSEDIAVVEISDDTLANLGKWPLPRDFHASLVDVLREYGAKMIVFDILFSEPTLYDDALSQAIKRAGNVYLPVAFYLGNYPQRNNPAPEAEAVLADITGVLKESCRGIGHVNVYVDADGKARSVPLFIKRGRTLFAQLGLRAACDRLGLDLNKVEFKKNRVTIDKRLDLPLLASGAFAVNYPAKWNNAFQHFSYFELLKSYADIQQGKKASLDLTQIKGKVCFIGLTATGTSDLKATPIENVYPMLGLQASVFNSIIQKKFIKDAGLFFNTLIDLLIFFLSVIICLRYSPLKAFIGNIILGSVYLAISTASFIILGIWVDLFFPGLLILLTYITTSTERFFCETKKRQLLEKELDIARTIQSNFLPPEIKESSGISISTFIQPAKFVAGDLYDVVTMENGRLGVFIGDVSGKGVPASLIMAQSISLFRVFSRLCSSYSDVLSRLNKELCGKFQGRFVTGLYMIIDMAAHKVYASSAGHGPLLIYKNKEAKIIEAELSAGLPLGVMEESLYQEVELDIEKNDKLFIFTDGLFESRNRQGEEFGIDRIKGIILENKDASPRYLSERIKEGVFRFSSGLPQYDDITLIVLAAAE